MGKVGTEELKTARKLWPRVGLAAAIFFSFGLSRQLLGEDAGQTPAPGASQNQTQSAVDPPPAIQSQPDSKAKQNDRIFWTLPNYLTVENASSAPPLTTGQKFKIVADGTFDPVEFAFVGIVSGINQAENADPTFGQGFIGYSKRYGTAYADTLIGNFGTGAIFPALLRQDPRYYQMGTGNFFHRFAHAALRIAIARSDSGKTEFNFSEFLGNAMAAGASNAYHPGPHTLASNVDVWSTQIVLDAAGYELKEFWPDIHRLLRRKRAS